MTSPKRIETDNRRVKKKTKQNKTNYKQEREWNKEEKNKKNLIKRCKIKIENKFELYRRDQW